METNTEEYEEAIKSALICEDSSDLRNSIASALDSLGYKHEIAASPDDTFEKLRFNQYDLIVMNEKFGGGAPEANAVYKHIQFMPMMTRRHIFFALIGQNFKTGDYMAAFSKSANIIINEKDVPNLKSLLKAAIADNDQFYKVYKESLVKMGKR